MLDIKLESREKAKIVNYKVLLWDIKLPLWVKVAITKMMHLRESQSSETVATVRYKVTFSEIVAIVREKSQF